VWFELQRLVLFFSGKSSGGGWGFFLPFRGLLKMCVFGAGSVEMTGLGGGKRTGNSNDNGNRRSLRDDKQKDGQRQGQGQRQRQQQKQRQGQPRIPAV
jgi:hypothetical protein